MLCLAATAMGAGVSPASALDASAIVSYAAPQLGFGGYVVNVHLTQIAATWRVPTISRTSKSGSAASWVGAQNSSGDFIQIGTEEDLDLTGSLTYSAFWSDATVQFVPQDLGTVKPGDKVTASMVQKGYGWTLKFTDEASGLSVSRPIDYGFEDRFDLAEWVQENPSSYTNGLPTIPYPTMSVPVFTGLTVNKAAADPSLSDGLVLITSSRRYEVPTAVTAGSFTFAPPTRSQAQYLSAIAGSDNAAVVFGDALKHWSQLSGHDRGTEVSEFSAAIRRTASSLASFHWAPAVRGPMGKFTHQCSSEVTLLTTWARSGLSSSGHAYQTWITSELARQSLASKVSAALHLPPVG